MAFKMVLTCNCIAGPWLERTGQQIIGGARDRAPSQGGGAWREVATILPSPARCASVARANHSDSFGLLATDSSFADFCDCASRAPHSGGLRGSAPRGSWECG